MNETLEKRIGDSYLNPTFIDGQTLLNTDMNEIVSVCKVAINENYYDIQRIINGTKTVTNSTKLNGATLSKYVSETLQADDNKVPTSQQVKAYIDAAIASLG